jgi:hypothetical protein
MKQTTLLYLSINSQVYHRQTIFSILSLFYYNEKIEEKCLKIVIFTDDIRYFKKYLNIKKYVVEYVLFTKDIQQSWLEWASIKESVNSVNLIAFIKPMCIKSILNSIGGNVIFIDTDTFFINPPFEKFLKIDNNNALMWLDEGCLSDKRKTWWEDIRNCFISHSFYWEDEKLKIPVDINMWNAGVVGISDFNTHLVNKALSLSLQFYEIIKHKIVYQEQIMFSYVLQTETILNGTNDVLFHYCYGFRKENFNRTLRNFFLKEISKLDKENILERVHEICLTEIPDKPVKNVYKELKNFFYKRKIGLYLAVERVKKTQRISTFFERGIKY